ncbi:MAG: hypothetical protein H7Y88_10935 [Phycisphaerales bacterium]|nr:hypothetical protein [Phycisphaerales bacterium]
MAMLLRGDDGSEFELSLLEDPSLEGEEREGGLDPAGEDAPWTTISFRVATPNEEWAESAPCVNPFQVQNLLDWLEGVGSGKPEEADLELLEPELKFAVINDNGKSVTLRIGFHLDDRPEEFNVDAPTDAQFVDLKLTREQVRVAALELRRDLESRSENEMHLEEAPSREPVPGEPNDEAERGDELDDEIEGIVGR